MEPVSIISGHTCKPAHYLAELVLSRQAKKRNQILSGKYWNETGWRTEYRKQLIAAHSILKLFEWSIVSAVLLSKDGNWIYSLSYRGLIELAKKEALRVEHTQKVLAQIKPIEVDKSNVEAVPVTERKSTTKDKLRQLE